MHAKNIAVRLDGSNSMNCARVEFIRDDVLVREERLRKQQANVRA